MNLIFGTSLLLVCIIAEVIFLAKVEGEKMPWKEIVANVNSGHIMLWLARVFVLVIYEYLVTNWSFGLIGELPVVAQWIFVIFAWDFCYYWSHRMHHRIHFLWNIHSVHHQAEHFNLSLGIRNSWYQPITSFPFFITLAFLGVGMEQFVLVSAFHYFIQFYNHNAIVKKSGFLEKILITPSHHRVHHGKNPEYINKNHGGTFVFWDKLFGTFQPERDDIQIRYGMTDNTNPDNPFWANMIPVFDYFGIKIKNQNARESNLKLKDEYIVIGSLLLFLLLLIYINNEQNWSILMLTSLFVIVFLGTIALGGVSQGQKIGLISWVILAVPVSIGFVVYFQISEMAILGIVGAVVMHGLLGMWKLVSLLKN
ncbi:MAG: sterol desaturase/sphingolipid hydroxylase (fatty acid hydroxylase superfamily) [Cognaticolwellia sp.]|jgi:sterol desaturase/sphingolipid hydroxylase (fatty acid hydroxylase superfamily)